MIINTTDKTTDCLSEREKAIIDLLVADPQISQESMGKALGLTVDGIRYHTDKLKKRGLLERIGGKRDGAWRVLI